MIHKPTTGYAFLKVDSDKLVVKSIASKYTNSNVKVGDTVHVVKGTVYAKFNENDEEIHVYSEDDIIFKIIEEHEGQLSLLTE